MLTEEGKRLKAELDARRTRHLRGEAPWSDGSDVPARRAEARHIGAVVEVGPGWEVWTDPERGRRNHDLEALGGIVLAVDAGGRVVDEWGEVRQAPATFRCYDPFAPWPYKAFRHISEDEVNRDAITIATARSLEIAVRRFCREVGKGKRTTLDSFEADLVTDAARLVAVLMGGRRWRG